MAKTVVRHLRPGWGALLLIAVTAPPALPQTTVRLEADVSEAYVNEPFSVSVRVDNFKECDPPVFPQIPDCSVRELPGGLDSSRTTIINGRMTVSRARSFLFELTPLAAGELVIPPVQVDVDGRQLRTRPARVLVHPSNAGELFAVEISAERKRIYVGQRARLTLTIWVKPARWQQRLLKASTMLSFISAPNLGPFPVRDIRTDVRFLKSSDGTTETYYTYTSWTDYVPDRPGRLNFDDIEVTIEYPTRLSRDFFGGLQVSAARRLRAHPKVESIEILPLPTNGRPANFTGAVGTFGIVVTARPTAVRVGDPIELTIEIRGDGPIETLPPPDLTSLPRLTAAFRVPREELAGEVSGSRKIFTQTIRAAHPDVTEIPPIEYPYFDPDRELYVVALSDAIPIAVIPAAELDTARLAEMTGVPSDHATPQLRVRDSLRGIETRERELLQAASPVRLGQLALVTFAPPGVFLVLWAYGSFVHARHPSQRRRQNALRNARRRIDQTRHLAPRESAAEIAAALAGYLADRLDQPAARLTGRAASELLQARNVARQTRDRWDSVLNRCEQASFGGSADGDADSLADEARACLQALERERL